MNNALEQRGPSHSDGLICTFRLIPENGDLDNTNTTCVHCSSSSGSSIKLGCVQSAALACAASDIALFDEWSAENATLVPVRKFW